MFASRLRASRRALSRETTSSSSTLMRCVCKVVKQNVKKKQAIATHRL
jgi:hypothetical protein